MRARPGWTAGAVVAAVLAAVPVRGQEARALSVLEQASARYAATTTMCADFTQHLSVPLLGDERSGHGRLCQRRPDRFAMRFDEPAGDVVVVDGTWVWVYYPSMDAAQVLRFPMANSPGGFDFHREFLERPAEKYRATWEAIETVMGHETNRIRLVPRAPASYVSAVVWIDTGEPILRQVRVEEENGSVRTVTLEAVDMAASPPAGWFTFDPPAGVQVIGGR